MGKAAQVQRLTEVIVRDPSRLTVVLGTSTNGSSWRAPSTSRAHFGQSSKARTWPSWQPLFALDRIWVHPPEALAAVWVHTSPTARGASDHLPLAGMIKVVRPEPTCESYMQGSHSLSK